MPIIKELLDKRVEELKERYSNKVECPKDCCENKGQFLSVGNTMILCECDCHKFFPQTLCPYQ